MCSQSVIEFKKDHIGKYNEMSSDSNESLKPRFDYKEYLKQDPMYKASDIRELQLWCRDQKPGSVIPPNIPDHRLFLFYYASDGNVDKTKKRIKNYFNLMKNSGDIFDDRDINSEALQRSLKTLSCCILPEKTKEGHVIYYTSINDLDYIDTANDTKLGIMIMELMLYEHGPAGGIVYIIDSKGLSFSHYLKLSFGVVKRFYDFIDGAMPLKIHSIYVINNTPAQKTLIKAFNPILTHPIFGKLVKIYNDKELDLFFKEGIPRELLPAHFGGSNYEIRSLVAKNSEELAKMKPYFEEEERIRKAVLKY